MFYSHEILTSRKYGVATIWLVATLGSRSTLRKVTRKAILNVNVPKACETITDSDAPMALRLQGSLLFGVSRVFSQQCGYVLSDMQNLRDKMRGAAVVIRDLQIDAGVTLTNDQLNLRIDPSFDIGIDMGFDLSVFDSSTESISRLDSQSSHDIPSTQTSLTSADEASPLLLGQFAHTSGNEFLDFGFEIEPATSEVPRAGEHADLSNVLEGPAIDEDPSFDIGEDGGLVFRQVGDQNFEDDIVSYLAEPSRSSTETEAAMGSGRAGEVMNLTPDLLSFDDDQVPLGERDPVLPQSEVSPLSTNVGPDRVPAFLLGSPKSQREETETTAEAPQRKAKEARPLQADRDTELSNKELKDWIEHYNDNMIRANDLKSARQSLAQARRNAAFWVLEQGLGGVSTNLAEDRQIHPLSVFSGQALLSALTGRESTVVGRKRSHSLTGSEADGERVSRARGFTDKDISTVEHRSEPHDDDGLIIRADDIETEVGRRPHSSLQDRLSLSMPWNQMASSRQGSARGSSHLGIGSSIRRGPPSVLSGRRSRLTTASPLDGRGQLPPQLDSPRLPPDDDSMDVDIEDYANFPAGSIGEAGELFELSGPLTAPDGQLADLSQQSIATLDDEAYNFLQYLDEQIKNGAQTDGSSFNITFDELLPPQFISKAVVAHGFMHVLALATKGLVDVEQEQAFGKIFLGLISHAEGAESRSGGSEIME